MARLSYIYNISISICHRVSAHTLSLFMWLNGMFIYDNMPINHIRSSIVHIMRYGIPHSQNGLYLFANISLQCYGKNIERSQVNVVITLLEIETNQAYKLYKTSSISGPKIALEKQVACFRYILYLI